MVISVQGEKESLALEKSESFVHDQLVMDFLRNGSSCIVCKIERKNWSCSVMGLGLGH